MSTAHLGEAFVANWHAQGAILDGEPARSGQSRSRNLRTPQFFVTRADKRAFLELTIFSEHPPTTKIKQGF